MGWGFSLLSADELAWAALDKPILSNNALYADVTLKWMYTLLGHTDHFDQSDSDKPASRMVDAKPGYLSSPGNAATTFTITIDASASPITFDWFGIINHNLHTLACTALVLEIADDGDFTTNKKNLSTTNISTALTSDRRFADLTLTDGGDPSRYANVPFARILITTSSGIPRIGQIILGRRRQQPYLPNMNWDPSQSETLADDFTSKSGVISRLSRGRGQRQMVATFRHDTDAIRGDITSWWEDIEGGEQPFFYIDEPATNPMDFWMMYLDAPELDYPWTLPATRDLSIVAAEQGTTFFSQE